DGARRALVARRGARGGARLLRARRVRASGARTVGRGVRALPARLRSPRRTRTGARRVTRVAETLGPIPAPADRWDAAAAHGLHGIDELVHRSNLLGADRAVANQGGGNTSMKETTLDHTGRETRVLWVKGSGTDLATIGAGGFAALRLDDLLPLRSRSSMDDAEMVDYLRRSGLVPGQPRPSIETL